jgi:methionyl-tRNA synthetase
MTTEQRPDLVIVAPPPTPNGDLHVGHLSGPYLGADVLTRFERLRGRAVVSAVSTDLNQTYVVTTAERLGRSPLELAEESHVAVKKTLARAGIEFDVIGRPDEAYNNFVSRYLGALVDDGAFVRRDVRTLVDPRDGRQLVEAYVAGRCPTCLQETCGNICESCGHPNDPTRLIGPQVGADGSRAVSTETAALVLPLERYRSRLERQWARTTMRPELAVLLESLLADRLPDFPITYQSGWGLPVGRPEWESSVYNVWAEMYPGHLHWAAVAAAERHGLAASDALWTSDESTEYVQFIGFDNSFFYAVAHAAIGLAAGDAGLPAAPGAQIITNQFYLLENSKFSTSQGHVIWGQDLLADWEADPVRLYLCLSNPETQEANFSVAEMERVLDARLMRPFERARRAWNQLVRSDRVWLEADAPWESSHVAVHARFELSYALDRFSLRRAATTFGSYLELVAHELELAAAGGGSCSPSAMGRLALYAAPLMPTFSAALADAVGVTEPLAWASAPVQRMERIDVIPEDLLTLRRMAVPVAEGLHAG